MLQRNAFLIPLSLGITHSLADCCSGFLIGTMPDDAPSPLLLVILYNAMAFAGQVPAGILTDKVNRPRLVLAMSLCAIAVALLLRDTAPLAAVLLAGAGSAFFHVSGGQVTLGLAENKAAAPGLFTGPGVMGLAIGGLLAATHQPALLLLFVLLLVFAAAMFLLPVRSLPARLQSVPGDHGLETHDVIMMLLLLGIAFRSVVWNVLDHIHQGNQGMLLAMAGAAMCGKLTGGWIADRVGWRRYCWIALGGAALLLSFGQELAWCLLPGIALLQSATPVALAAMYRALPRFPATASGLSLGLAIAAGGIPFALPGTHISAGWEWLLLPALGAALLYGFALWRQQKRNPLRS